MRSASMERRDFVAPRGGAAVPPFAAETPSPPPIAAGREARGLVIE